jgi:hypothetical protein
MMVMTAAVEGREQEFNDWYQDLHLQQLVAIDGVTSAQRYKACRILTEGVSQPYLAVYELETDDVDQVLSTMVAKAGTEDMVLSDAMDPSTRVIIYEEIGPRVDQLA